MSHSHIIHEEQEFSVVSGQDVNRAIHELSPAAAAAAARRLFGAVIAIASRHQWHSVCCALALSLAALLCSCSSISGNIDPAMHKRRRGADPPATPIAEVPEPVASKLKINRTSGECPSETCSCQSPVVSVDAALAKVRATKAFGGSMPSRGPLNETKVLRAIVDDYLSHSRLADDLPPVSGRICESRLFCFTLTINIARALIVFGWLF